MVRVKARVQGRGDPALTPAPLPVCHSRTRWFRPAGSGFRGGGLMEQPVGQRARGWELCPPVPQTQPGVCSHPPPPGPSWVLARLSPPAGKCSFCVTLSHSQLCPSSGPPRGLAGLPPAPQEAGARQALAGRLAQPAAADCPTACAPVFTRGSQSAPWLGPGPIFPARLLTVAFHLPVPLS